MDKNIKSNNLENNYSKQEKNYKKYHCPKCGKIVNQLFNDLCNFCHSETANIFNMDTKDIKLCDTCNSLFEGLKTIKSKSFDNAIFQIIKNRIKPSKDFKNFNSNIEIEKINENNINVHLNIKALSKGNISISEEFTIPLKVKNITCEQCSKKNTEYFEAVLQIRNKNNEIVKEVLEKLDFILKEEEKRSVFATKTEESKNGIDIYITSQKHIKDIGKKLHEIFGGEMKINEQLFSKDHLTSKNLYRINLLLRIPDFKKGSTIKIKDKLIYITSIKSNFILGLDLINDKSIKTKYNFDEVELIQKEPIETVVVKTKPHPEILNPITYQNETVMNPQRIKNNKVNIIIHNNSIWII